MAVLKIEGLRGLEALIACHVPELVELICTDAAGPGHRLEVPSLALILERSRYFPDQEEITFEPSANSVVLNVGRHVQEIKLQLTTATTYQRAELEQKILNLFLETDGHPGVLFTDLTSCPELGPFVAAWELEEDQWRNERVMERSPRSEMKITGLLPALVTRRGVYSMEHLQLGLQIGPLVDPTATPPDFSADSVDVIEINEDGTFSPL